MSIIIIRRIIRIIRIIICHAGHESCEVYNGEKWKLEQCQYEDTIIMHRP